VDAELSLTEMQKKWQEVLFYLSKKRCTQNMQKVKKCSDDINKYIPGYDA
jgi:hypothetical protein